MSNQMQDTVSPDRETEINEAMGKLRSQEARVSSLTNKLLARIKPVCRPPANAEVANVGNTPKSGSPAPLAGGIESVANGIRATADYVEAVLDRLEI